ncbi:MAG TPA: DUF309 domain-containing protein [Anaerolineaceae bacterium]|nr:DUF309 domain-containing protein [Anaerolineaceae bacterium]HQN44412.1 DUF309 domain-containing protein [Anaerolineaceae bacterium]
MVGQDLEANLIEGCGEALPRLAQRGMEHFNQGEYFEAHEWLELAWREEKRPIRELYRGILQVGVAYHHLRRGNIRGAIRLLERAEGWLAQFPDVCQGVDVRRLRQDADRVRQVLEENEATGATVRIDLRPVSFQQTKE